MDWFTRLRMRQRNATPRDPAIHDLMMADSKLDIISERNRRLPKKSNILELAKKDYGEHLQKLSDKPIRYNASEMKMARSHGPPSNDDDDYDSDADSVSSSISDNSLDDSRRITVKKAAAESIKSAAKAAIKLSTALKQGKTLEDQGPAYAEWKVKNTAKKVALSAIKQLPAATPRAAGVRRNLLRALGLSATPSTPPPSDASATEESREEGKLTALAKNLRAKADEKITSDEPDIVALGAGV